MDYCQNCYSPDSLFSMQITFDYNGCSIDFLECFKYCTGYKIEKEIDPKICEMCIFQLKTAYSMKQYISGAMSDSSQAPVHSMYATASIIANPLPILPSKEPELKKETFTDSEDTIDLPAPKHRKCQKLKRELNFIKFHRKDKRSKPLILSECTVEDVKTENEHIQAIDNSDNDNFGWDFPDERKVFDNRSDEELVLEKPYKCHHCQARFAKKKLCRNHINRNHNEDYLHFLYKCKMCEKVFKSHGGFRTHFACHHHTETSSTNRRPAEKCKNFLCVHCGRSFLFPSDLEIHQKSHSDERAYKCTIENCGSAFKTKYALDRHVGAVHTEREGEFTCKSCNLQFTKQDILETHNVSHSEKTACACLRCAENLSCLIEMQKHLLERHKTDMDRYRPVDGNGIADKIFKCSQCDTVYAIFFSLRQHIIAEHYGEKNTFQCEVCSKIYRTKFMLEQHAFTHKEVLPFQCAEENCTYKSNNKQNFKGHLKRLHDLEYDEKLHGYNAERSMELSKKHEEILKRGYIRPYLSKKASQKKIVTTNPWKCKQCPRTFSHSGNLARHINVEHKHLLYECKFCDRKFSGQAGLWIHSFSHRKTKPFNCPSCEYRTTHKLNFKGHLKKRHEITYNEQIHGYKETMKEVMNYIMKRKDNRDDQTTAVSIQDQKVD